jgi:tetratricopeptide (TPR) repeat protein
LARTERRRVQRPKQAPRPERERGRKRAPKQPTVEETLFFSRLRRQAKWVFVLLAVAFAFTFVVFGVGSGGSGLGDLLFLEGGGQSGDQPSVEEAREKLEENPRSAEAQYELAQALQAEGKTEEAITALERYTQLRPSDREKLEELAGLYLTKAQAAEQRARIAQVEASLVTGGGIFNLTFQGPKDEAIALGDPVAPSIEDAVSGESNEELNKHFTEMSGAYRDAKDTYERVVKVAPNDASAFQNLALAAQQAGDTQRAIEAFEKFIELAPDDPSVGIVKEQLKQLRASLQPAVQAQPAG